MMEVQGLVEIVIVTGISGAGWRTTAHTIEGLGWYVVDNLPPVMLPILVDRTGTAERLAVMVDVYSREEFEQLPTTFTKAKARDCYATVLFPETSDDVVVQRQESNRRSLPPQHGGRLLNGIMRERRLLADLWASVDIVVGTSRLSVRQLTQHISSHFGADAADSLNVALIPLGFKNGLSIDADIVSDTCFLPNPYRVPELCPKTGLFPDMISCVPSQDAVQEFQGCMLEVIGVTAPRYLTESRRQVAVAIGYTGGKHRSTSMTEELAIRLRSRGYGVSALHRDLRKE